MAAITVKNVDFSYSSLATRPALSNINLAVEAGSFVCLIGHTGSGKSTLVSLIDGLIKPDHGTITVGKTTVDHEAKAADLSRLRQHVGYVFQFPENQLFADTVAKDIAFGPTNLGWDEAQIKAAVKEALTMVGLPAEFGQRSPFSLSGGQMRRVAIAGVLAMKPAILILDEATAGLDAASTRQLLANIKKLNNEGTTILMITHQMDQVADLADQVLVFNQGRIVKNATPQAVFSDDDFLAKNHLDQPAAVKINQRLQQKGLKMGFNLTLPELADSLANQLKEGGRH